MERNKTLADLISELDISRQSLTNWRKISDAPIGMDLAEWCRWCGANNKRIKLSESARAEMRRIPDDEPEPEPANEEPEGDALSSSGGGLPDDCPYDGIVDAGDFSYAEAKIREQVRGQILTNDVSRVNLEKERGKLVTKSEHIADMITITNMVQAGVEKLSAVAMQKIEGLNGKQRAAVVAAIDAAGVEIMLEIRNG